MYFVNRVFYVCRTWNKGIYFGNEICFSQYGRTYHPTTTKWRSRQDVITLILVSSNLLATLIRTRGGQDNISGRNGPSMQRTVSYRTVSRDGDKKESFLVQCLTDDQILAFLTGLLKAFRTGRFHFEWDTIIFMSNFMRIIFELNVLMIRCVSWLHVVLVSVFACCTFTVWRLYLIFLPLAWIAKFFGAKASALCLNFNLAESF